LGFYPGSEAGGEYVLMDIIRLFLDYRVDFKTEGHKHCRPGWVNTPCPFCTGNEGYHLGYDTAGDYFSCWRCGGKGVVTALSRLLHIPESEVRNILPQYGGKTRRRKAPEAKVQLLPFKHPSGTGPLLLNHRRYLEKRRFDPDALVEQWGLLGTGPVSTLRTQEKVIHYSHRILIPIYWEGVEVSFQTRDVTGKHDLRYIACPEERETIKHKHLLYGTTERFQSPEAVVVEGVTDAWRFQGKAVATFGIKYTPKQLRLLSKLFQRVVVIFDSDPQAIEQANRLVAELKFRGVRAETVRIEDDPGSMSDREAHSLLRKIGF